MYINRNININANVIINVSINKKYNTIQRDKMKYNTM